MAKSFRIQSNPGLLKALADFPKLVKERERNYREREKDIRRFESVSRQLLNQKKKADVHPWRQCPYGEHWVKAHPLRVKPSRKNPQGSTTVRSAHCADNPSGKDHLYVEEIIEIAKLNFSAVAVRPCAMALGYSRGNDFDDLIAGWTEYWNSVLKPSDKLDVNLVKALIATESSFEPILLANKKNSNSARGLLQVTNLSRKILGDTKGELKDHFVVATKDDLNEPVVNICAGIRWLFHKQKLATSKLKRSANWEETVAEYKGLSTVSKKRGDVLLKKFIQIYEELSKCETKAR